MGKKFRGDFGEQLKARVSQTRVEENFGTNEKKKRETKFPNKEEGKYFGDFFSDIITLLH